MIPRRVQGRRFRLRRSARGPGVSSLARAYRAPCPLRDVLQRTRARPARFGCSADYGLFNCSIHHRHSWSRYYRGCWHRTCPPLAFAHRFAVRPSAMSRNCLLAREWAIFAPAAVLGRGSHLSGSLSGIRPRPPVTRRRLGSPLHYQLADRAASQPPLLATVSRGYRPRRADRRSITEPFAVPIFTGMHGLVSETSIYVRQNQPGACSAAARASTALPSARRRVRHRQQRVRRSRRAPQEAPQRARGRRARARGRRGGPLRARRREGSRPPEALDLTISRRTAPVPARVVSASACAQVPVPA